jgi:hypothetical protein
MSSCFDIHVSNPSNMWSDGTGVGDYLGKSVNDGDRLIEMFPSAALLTAK